MLYEADMEGSAFTVSDIVGRLSRTGDADAREYIHRQVRYWSNEGILRPIGPLRPGKGRERLFVAAEIMRAALLVEMAKWHIVVGAMKILMDAVEGEANKHAHGDLLGLIDLDQNYFRFSTLGHPKGYMLLRPGVLPPPRINRSEFYINAPKLKQDIGL